MHRGITASAVAFIAATLTACGGGPTLSNGTPTSKIDYEASRKQAAEAYELRRNPANYKPLTDRDFALLVKDPDAHASEMVIIYGQVSQFDAATGTSEFRANTGALPPSGPVTIYEQNSYVTVPDPGLTANVVKDDVLRIYATVAGSYSYELQRGGETTVPRFTAYIIDNLTQGAQ